MPSTEAWTIGRLLEWTTEFLKGRGADSPRLDAEVLLAQALGCKRIELYTRFTEEPPEPTRAAFRELVKRRAEGTPVAYLAGKREFYSLSFRVSPAVLIPRPETEFLVIRLLDLAGERADSDPPLNLVDVGTGSGVIAICAAKYSPKARVTAIDISPEALEIARQNATDHGVDERITFSRGDLLAGAPEGANFDFIVSNPPYIGASEFETLDRDVRDYEPRLALVGGPTGIETIARLIPQAAERLVPGGWLLFEIGATQAEQAQSLVEADSRLEWFPIKKDSAGLPRVAQARRRS